MLTPFSPSLHMNLYPMLAIPDGDVDNVIDMIEEGTFQNQFSAVFYL